MLQLFFLPCSANHSGDYRIRIDAYDVTSVSFTEGKAYVYRRSKPDSALIVTDPKAVEFLRRWTDVPQ